MKETLEPLQGEKDLDPNLAQISIVVAIATAAIALAIYIGQLYYLDQVNTLQTMQAQLEVEEDVDGPSEVLTAFLAEQAPNLSHCQAMSGHCATAALLVALFSVTISFTSRRMEWVIGAAVCLIALFLVVMARGGI